MAMDWAARKLTVVTDSSDPQPKLKRVIQFG